MAILQDILALSVVTERFSRIRTPPNMLQRHFGMQIGGSAVRNVSGRQFTMDILDYRRSISQGSAPGSPPTYIAPQLIGSMSVQMARSYDAMRLDYEKLLMIRELGQNAGTRDRMGMSYYSAQMKEMHRRQSNFREIMVAGALRGSFDMQFVSETVWAPVFSRGGNPGFTINFQMPAGNQNQLNMTGGGNIIDLTWANAGAKIIDHLMDVSAAFENLVGEPLAYVLCPSTTWKKVIANTQVINTAGSANTPFAQFDFVGEKAEDGSPTGTKRAVLRGYPLVEWIINDSVLEVNNATTKLLPDNSATFMIKPDPSWFAMVEGSEFIAENDWTPAKEEFGFKAWAMPKAVPTSVELHSIQNSMVEFKLPKAIAFGTVIF